MENSITILGPDRSPLGPFPVQEIIRKIESGEIRGDTLAHAPGFAEWQPVSQVLAKLNLTRPAPLVSPMPNYLQANAYAIDMAVPGLHYADFFQRFVAYFIDRFIVFGMTCVLFLICLLPMLIEIGISPDLQQQFRDSDNASSDHAQITTPLIIFVILLYGGLFAAMVGAFLADWLYHARLESGKNEGTWGKQMMGIRITDVQGNQISFMRATGRHFSRVFVSNATCLIGYIIGLFGDKKQTLHDLMANTIVIRK